MIDRPPSRGGPMSPVGCAFSTRRELFQLRFDTLSIAWSLEGCGPTPKLLRGGLAPFLTRGDEKVTQVRRGGTIQRRACARGSGFESGCAAADRKSLGLLVTLVLLLVELVTLFAGDFKPTVMADCQVL